MRALVLLLIACGPKPGGETPANAAKPGGEIVLYRDHALVRQRIELDVPPAAKATVRFRVAAGIDAEDLVVFERDQFTIESLHLFGDATPAKVDRLVDALDEPPLDEDLELPSEPPEARPPAPRDAELVIGAPHAGHYAIHVGYLTDRITWEAAYTMTTTPARDRAVVQGALAIRNATGIKFSNMQVRIIDAELGPSIRRAAEMLVGDYVGSEPTTTPTAIPRDIGRFDVVDGETRAELFDDTSPRPMRSVLVYDPIGTASDRASAAPVRDINLGLEAPASTRVTESFEVSRDAVATRGLPGGPVRLLERRTGGELGVLGESRMFEVSTRVAEVDTIAVGTADGVVGHRERREYTFDETHKRLVEDFVLSIDNTRTSPVEVVIREHLYRGQNWTLAYRSAPIAQKEGPQQISMRMIVPPNSERKLLYVVVYTWQ